MFFSQKQSVTIAEFYCGEPPGQARGDVVRYNQWPTPEPGYRVPPFHTIVLDLRAPEDELLAKMDKGTRYEIRRAEKDGVSCESLGIAEAVAAVETFAEFYDQAAALKSLPPVDRKWLGAMARAGQLELSRVWQGETTLAWHAYYRGETSAVLLFSMSAHRASADNPFRQLAGRANRFLHWQDIRRFRDAGLSFVDFGGWYAGSEDQALLQINKFKEDFGGTPGEVYNVLRGRTLKGKLAVWWVKRKVRGK